MNMFVRGSIIAKNISYSVVVGARVTKHAVFFYLRKGAIFSVLCEVLKLKSVFFLLVASQPHSHWPLSPVILYVCMCK